MSLGQVEMSLREGGQVLMMFASLRVEGNVVASDIFMVCEFRDIFPEVIGDLPPECEIEFAINLVPGIRLVSMASYRIPALELAELKKQLEDLLEKNFVRLSVS